MPTVYHHTGPPKNGNFVVCANCFSVEVFLNVVQNVQLSLYFIHFNNAKLILIFQYFNNDEPG